MYATSPNNEEKMKAFCDQLREFTEELTFERESMENAIKQEEIRDAEDVSAFADRIADEKSKNAVNLEQLDSELAKLEGEVQELKREKTRWLERQTESTSELMAQLDIAEKVLAAEKALGDCFAEFIDSMNNLSHKSMNDQLEVLKNNLDALKIEKNQLSVCTADQKATISTLEPLMVPTCGATYKERNVLIVSLRSQLNKLRIQYQKSRLHEESLKAALSA